MELNQIYFDPLWLDTARTLEGNGCGLLLEAIVAYQVYKSVPPRDFNKEALGAFKVIKAQIDFENDYEPGTCADLTDCHGNKL